MDVPFINLSRAINKVKNKIINDWLFCLEHTQFISGNFLETLAQECKKILKVPYFIPTSNGSDAILVGLKALGVKPGIKVAVPNLTFWAPVEAIMVLGADPILIDIDPYDLQMNFEEFKKAHDKFKFKHAILVHLYGWTSHRLKEFRQFCLKNEIELLEDGAQAFGVEYENESIYSNAKLATISFYPAKVVGACGDAGAITTTDPIIYEKCISLVNHGRFEHYRYKDVGFNARGNAIPASFIVNMLKIYDEMIDSRLKAKTIYMEHLLSNNNIKTYLPPNNVKENAYLSVFTTTHKAEYIVEELKKRGIGCARTYPETIDMQKPTQQALRVSDLKYSKDFVSKVFNLPLFAYITKEECEYAANGLLNIVN